MVLYLDRKEPDKVKPLLQELVEIRRKVLGPEHPLTAEASITWQSCTDLQTTTTKLNRSTRKCCKFGRKFLGRNIPTP